VPVFPTVANTWDAAFYHQSAASLAHGEGYTFQGKPTAFFPPGYPFLLSLADRAVGSGPRTGQAVNLILSLLLAAAVAALVREIWGGIAARWTLVLLALDPTQIAMPAFLMSETGCAAALAVFMFLVLRWARLGTRSALVGAAIAGTAAGFIRGHAFLVIPAVFFALVWARAVTVRRAVLPAILCLALAGAGLVWWGARNERALGGRVLLATNGGINLLLGNNPNARGGRAEPPGGVPQTGDEIRDEAVAARRAWAFVRNHPVRTALLLPMKAARLWAFAPVVTYRAELAAKAGRVSAGVLLVWAQLVHLLALVVTAILLMRSRRLRAPATASGIWSALLVTVFAVWTAGHLPFLGGARYLFPIQPLLIASIAILAAGSARPRPGVDDGGEA